MTTHQPGDPVLVRLPHQPGRVPAIYVREVGGRHEVLLADGARKTLPGYRVRSVDDTNP